MNLNIVQIVRDIGTGRYERRPVFIADRWQRSEFEYFNVHRAEWRKVINWNSRERLFDMHISDATLNALAAIGWTVNGMRAEKLFANIAPVGTISNGSRVLHVQFDESGRWLEIVDAWGKVLKDFDSRDYVGKAAEFAILIEGFAIVRNK